jgi:hypothetical protein
MDIARDTSRFFLRMRATAPAREQSLTNGEEWRGDFKCAAPRLRHCFIFVRSNDRVHMRDCRCNTLSHETLEKLEYVFRLVHFFIVVVNVRFRPGQSDSDLDFW